MTRFPSPGFFPGAAALACGWASVALLWLIGRRLPELSPWQLWLTLVALAALPAFGLWLAIMVRKRERFLRFSEASLLRHWLSGGLLPAARAILVAAVLALVALWQAYFIAPQEWLLLTLAPPLYVATTAGLRRLLAGQFAQPAFAWGSVQRWSRWLFTFVVGAAWIVLMLRGALQERMAHPGMDPAGLDQAIARIAGARAGLARWGLDGLLALQFTSDAARDLLPWRWLRLAVLALSGPGATLTLLACAMGGMAGLRAPIRRAARLRAASFSPLLVALLCTLGTAIGLSIAASLEAATHDHASPLALQRLPRCERIAGDYYTVGTSRELRQIALRAVASARAAPALCAQMQEVKMALDRALEGYLDWYFSLPAEWGRVFHLLTGGADAFLQARLQRTLEATPGLAPWLDAVRQQSALADATYGRALDHAQAAVLATHHLMLDARRCLVQQDIPGSVPELQVLDSTRLRLAGSAGAGIAAGTFASAVAAKALGKAGMKAAAKVLAKAAAKQGLAKAGGAAIAGAALGSVLPGLGTGVGAATGFALGALAGAGIDWTLLRAEEHVDRARMKTDLRAALDEQLDAVDSALACAPAPAAPHAPEGEAAGAGR